MNKLVKRSEGRIKSCISWKFNFRILLCCVVTSLPLVMLFRHANRSIKEIIYINIVTVRLFVCLIVCLLVTFFPWKQPINESLIEKRGICPWVTNWDKKDKEIFCLWVTLLRINGTTLPVSKLEWGDASGTSEILVFNMYKFNMYAGFLFILLICEY